MCGLTYCKNRLQKKEVKGPVQRINLNRIFSLLCLLNQKVLFVTRAQIERKFLKCVGKN